MNELIDHNYNDSDSDYIMPDNSPSHCSEWLDLCEPEQDELTEQEPEPEQEVQDETTETESDLSNKSSYLMSEYSESVKSESTSSSMGTYDYQDSFIDDSAEYNEQKLTEQQIKHIVYCNSPFCTTCYCIRSQQKKE